MPPSESRQAYQPFVRVVYSRPTEVLTFGTKLEQCSSYVLMEANMLKVFVEEAAALTSITLFVGMVAVWAQVIPQL